MLGAGESSEVPGRLLHTSFGSRRPSTTVSQSVPYCAVGEYSLTPDSTQYRSFRRRTYCVVLPAEHVQVWAFSVAIYILRVTLSDCLYVIQHRVLAVLGNYLKRSYLRVIKTH